MKKLHLAILGAVAGVIGLVAVNFDGLNTQAIRNVRDCDNNSIVYCGVLSQNELIKKFDENKNDVQKIYAHYGITRNDITGKTSQVKIGKIYRDGRVEVDGKVVATGAHSVGRQTSSNSKKVTINGKTYYERTDATGIPKTPGYIDAFVLMRDGKFYRAIMTSCGNPTVAKAKETPKPPKYACDALTASKISRTEYNFTAKASASNGATIIKYHFDFGDGQKTSQTAAAVKHTYAKPGTYKIKVSVEVKVSGANKTVTSKECEKTITVEEEPKQPVYKCDELGARVIKLEDRSYAYDLTYTAKDGATLTNVDFDFGDGQKQTVSLANLDNVTHTYAKAGEYKTVATLHFSVTEQGKKVVKDVNCETSISITPEACPLNPSLPKDDEGCAPCEVPGKEQYPKDSPKCAEEKENCEVPGKEHLPKDSDECKETPVTPPELPKTGAGEFISGGLGLSALIAAGYYWHASRRGLLEALLNR